MTNNKITAYIRKSYTDKVVVHIRVRIDNKYVVESLGIELKSDKDFDENKEEIKQHVSAADDLNMIIRKKKAMANEIFIKYRLAGKILDIKTFKTEFKNPTSAIDFNAFVFKTINEHKPDIAYNTFRTLNSFYNVIVKYKPYCTFSDVTQDYVSGFARYLKTSRGCAESRIARMLKFLKTYTDMAIRKDFITKDNNPFLGYKIKSKKKTPVFLEEEEVKRLLEIYRTDKLTHSQKRVLRWFLFACFAGGIRISDLRALTFDNIVSKTYLVFMPQKTKSTNPVTVRFRLSKVALSLIKDEGRVQGKLFNMFTDQVINRTLKDIFKFADIKRQKISFHTSRHTFAVIYLLNMKSAMAFPTLSKILGHSTVKQTLDTYVGITQLMLDEGISNFDKFY